MYGQLGSGLLGGWSAVSNGGSFDVASRAAVEREAWDEYRRSRHRPPWARLNVAPVTAARPRPRVAAAAVVPAAAGL
jgi:hypothetical protein